MNIGRNDKCPCDSGKKYKKCCIDITAKISRHQPNERLKQFGLKLTFSLLYDKQGTEYLNKIKTLPFEESVKLVSCLDGMLNDNLATDKNFVENCIKYLLFGPSQQMALDALKQKELVFLNEMLLLNFFKLLLLTNPNSKPNITDNEINRAVGDILLQLNDYPESLYHKKYKKEDIPPRNEIKRFLIKNFMFVAKDVLKWAILRYYMMCVELQGRLEASSSFFNLNEIFQKHYGLSLIQYITCICGLNCVFSTHVSIINEETCFDATNMPKTQQAIFYSLVRLNWEDYKKELTDELGVEEDMSTKVMTIKKYPLLRIGDNTYCISRNYLQRKLSENLYWMLFEACKKEFNDDIHRFTNLWGEIFQTYIEWLLENAGIKNYKKRLRIKDVKYKNQKNEIDLLVYDDNNIAIIEIKSSRLNKKTVETGDLTSFENDLKKTYKDCAVQMKGILQSVNDNEYDLTPFDIKQIKNVYPIFLFLEPMPQWPLIDEHYQQILIDTKFPQIIQKAIQVKRPIVMSAVEFEKMLIYIKDGKIFSLLAEKTSNIINNEQSVKNFLFNKQVKSKLPESIQNKLDEINEKLIGILYNK